LLATSRYHLRALWSRYADAVLTGTLRSPAFVCPSRRHRCPTIGARTNGTEAFAANRPFTTYVHSSRRTPYCQDRWACPSRPETKNQNSIQYEFRVRSTECLYGRQARRISRSWCSCQPLSCCQANGCVDWLCKLDGDLQTVSWRCPVRDKARRAVVGDDAVGDKVYVRQ
jgi:hypothetical protein